MSIFCNIPLNMFIILGVSRDSWIEHVIVNNGIVMVQAAYWSLELEYKVATHFIGLSDR